MKSRRCLLVLSLLCSLSQAPDGEKSGLMGALSGGTEMGIAASSLRGRGAGRGPWQMLVMVFLEEISRFFSRVIV